VSGAGTQPDPAVLPRGAAPRHVRAAIGLVGQPAHHCGRPPRRQLLGPGGADLLVDTATARGVEVAGLGHDGGGQLLADPPAGQQIADAGQVEVQGAGDGEAARAVEGRDAAGQPDLVADPPADRGRVEPVVGDLRLDLRPRERDDLRLLRRGERPAHPLEAGDPVNPIGVGARSGIGGERAEASQHRGDLGHDRIHLPAPLVRSHVRSVAPSTDNICRDRRSPRPRRSTH